MQWRVSVLTLAALLAASFSGRHAVAGNCVSCGQQHVPVCVQGCNHNHGHNKICGPEVGCASGHPWCARYPCAKYHNYDCSALPPIALSRYADNGDFTCAKRCFGDMYPHHPRYWFNNQPYAVPHDSLPAKSDDPSADALRSP